MEDLWCRYHQDDVERDDEGHEVEEEGVIHEEPARTHTCKTVKAHTRETVKVTRVRQSHATCQQHAKFQQGATRESWMAFFALCLSINFLESWALLERLPADD